MARRPQLEDGYTRIANEILEQAARHRLNGTQFRLLMIIWRYTYGYRRKEAEFTLPFLADAIGASRSQVHRELTALIERNVLEVVAGGSGKPRLLRFNKDSNKWAAGPPKAPRTLRKPAPPPPAPEPPKPKRKREKRQYSPDDTYYKMAAYFHSKIKDMAEQIGFNHASIDKVDLQKWADDFRLLVERDGVTDKRLIRDVIDWVTQDEFWRVNVISGKKFREKFPDLVLRMRAKDAKRPPPPPPPKQSSMIDRLAAAQEWIDAGGDPYEFKPD